MAKELQEINMDLIREMRKNGQGLEAEMLLEAHQKSIHKSIEEGTKKNFVLDRKVRMQKNRNKGLCSCGRPRFSKKTTQCKRCYGYKQKYREKLKCQKKEQNQV